MIFSSLTFLFLFLPLALIAYYLIDRKFRNLLLLFVSFVFYAWGEHRFVFVMLGLCLINYFLAYGIFAFKSSRLRLILLWGGYCWMPVSCSSISI